jgi:hypothetical protein
MVARFATAPDHLYVQPTASTQKVILHRLEAEVDELWSFVGKRKIKIQTYVTEVVARDIKPLGLAAIASERVAA